MKHIFWRWIRHTKRTRKRKTITSLLRIHAYESVKSIQSPNKRQNIHVRGIVLSLVASALRLLQIFSIVHRIAEKCLRTSVIVKKRSPIFHEINTIFAGNYLAEFSFISCPEENDSGQTQVSTKDDPGCENFIEFPAAGTWQRLHSFFRYHHDGTCRAIAVNAKTSDTSHLAHKPEHSRQEQEYRNSPSLTTAITRTTKGWEFKFLEKRKQHKPELRRYWRVNTRLTHKNV